MLLHHHAGGAHLYPIVVSSVDLGAASWLRDPVNAQMAVDQLAAS
jgi:hypothetical protein